MVTPNGRFGRDNEGCTTGFSILANIKKNKKYVLDIFETWLEHHSEKQFEQVR